MPAHARFLIHRPNPSPLALALVLSFGLLVTGAACTPKKSAEITLEPVAQVVADPESLDVNTAYAEGLQAFWAGDYKNAALLFDSLVRRQDDQTLRSKALFSLACARLAGADNPDDLKAAREIWLEWEKGASGTPPQADPRMLTPFVRRAKFFALPKEQAAGVKPQAPKSASGEQELLRRLQEKDKEVQHLQKQIKALEAIHREIQEKKKMSAQ